MLEKMLDLKIIFMIKNWRDHNYHPLPKIELNIPQKWLNLETNKYSIYYTSLNHTDIIQLLYNLYA